MKVVKISSLENNFNIEKKPLIAIWGFFDGWHLGHQALLQQMQDLAKKYHYQTLVISFDRKPQSVLAKHEMPILLNQQDKQKFLVQQQIDYYCEITFSQEFAKITAGAFINFLLANQVAAVVSSHDVRFGAQGEGNLALLQNSRLKVFLSEDVFDQDGQKISSSYIKELLVHKNITHANYLLNSQYTIAGRVVDGIKEGRTLGFRTANLALTDNYLVPGVAVYISLTEVDGHWHQSMTVIIMRDGKPLVETYLLNFNQDIYGKVIKVKFLTYLRDNDNFASKAALVAQIEQDLVATIAYFNNVA